MSTKRRAGNELNADNWDETEESEEAGTFRMASDRDIQTRAIRTAKRRSNMSSEDSKKGIFSNFGGFNKTPSSVASSSPFSFLSSMKNGSSESSNSILKKEPQKPTEHKIETKTSQSSISQLTKQTATPTPLPSFGETKSQSSVAQGFGSQRVSSPLKYSDEYCAHLKDLNQSICEWIKQNVEKNPYCILTPIFEDYKKYLKDFDKYKESNKKVEVPSLTTSSDDKKSSDIISNIKDNIFSGVLTPQTAQAIFQTPKPSDKAESKVTSPPSVLFGQGFSSTPVSKAPPMFSFSQNTPITSGSNFSFGTGKPFTFQSNIIPEESNTEQKQEEENNEDDEPPKVTFTPVVEEDSVYSKKCKVFVTTKGQYNERGVGTLYLKPIANSEKYQLIVRADTSLGNLLINMVLSEAIPTKRMGKNNVLLVTIPTPESKPPPVPVLLRVKTSEEADDLLETLEKYKK